MVCGRYFENVTVGRSSLQHIYTAYSACCARNAAALSTSCALKASLHRPSTVRFNSEASRLASARSIHDRIGATPRRASLALQKLHPQTCFGQMRSTGRFSADIVCSRVDGLPRLSARFFALRRSICERVRTIGNVSVSEERMRHQRIISASLRYTKIEIPPRSTLSFPRNTSCCFAYYVQCC